MKKLLAFFIAAALCLTMCACGEPEPTSVYETETIRINGIYVDDSYESSDGAPLKRVYLFYTLNAVSENTEIDSVNTDMIIADTNTYTAGNHVRKLTACKYTPNYYYSSYIEDVYVGTSLNVAATFIVPEGDLTGSKTITFADTQIPEIAEIRMSTDDIQRFNSPEEIAQAIDPEGYAAEMLAREEADEETVKLVNSYLDYHYWYTINSLGTYKVEFYAPNEFVMITNIATSSGVYTILNGYIKCSYSNGNGFEIPYTLTDSGIKLDLSAAVDVH